MRIPILVWIAVAVVGCLKALEWWSGYDVDVTASLGFFMPAVLIPLALVPTVIAIVEIVRSVGSNRSGAARFIAPAFALMLVALQMMLPSLVLPGLKMRMSRFGEAEFVQLANDIRTLAEGEKHLADFGRSHARALRDEHAILRSSRSWPPKIFLEDRHVEIIWGSGLTGALHVRILGERASPPRPDGYVFEVRSLYPNVWLSRSS